MVAWNKFLSALQGLETIRELAITSFNLSAELIARVLDSTSRLVGENGTTLELPWRSSGDDLIPVVEACSNLQFREGNIFCLLCDNRWNQLSFSRIEFTQDESEALAHILSTSCCPTTRLCLYDCTLQNGGGKLVADALKDNTSLKSVSLMGRHHHDALFLYYVSAILSIQQVCGTAFLLGCAANKCCYYGGFRQECC